MAEFRTGLDPFSADPDSQRRGWPLVCSGGATEAAMADSETLETAGFPREEAP